MTYNVFGGTLNPAQPDDWKYLKLPLACTEFSTRHTAMRLLPAVTS